MSKGLIAGIVAGVIILIVISGVLLWKVKVYNRKFKELTQAELMLFETGDPSSINPELGLDDQVGNSIVPVCFSKLLLAQFRMPSCQSMGSFTVQPGRRIWGLFLCSSYST